MRQDSFLCFKSNSVILNLLFGFRSRDILLSRQLITETEEAIRSRLKPLLDQAEVCKGVMKKRSSFILGSRNSQDCLQDRNYCKENYITIRKKIQDFHYWSIVIEA